MNRRKIGRTADGKGMEMYKEESEGGRTERIERKLRQGYRERGRDKRMN